MVGHGATTSKVAVLLKQYLICEKRVEKGRRKKWTNYLREVQARRQPTLILQSVLQPTTVSPVEVHPKLSFGAIWKSINASHLIALHLAASQGPQTRERNPRDKTTPRFPTKADLSHILGNSIF